jgi:zinc transporter
LGRALSSVTQDLELVQERARLLNEEIDRRLNERTNRNLYFVSVAATLFLPITLLSSIFGMNVGGLPWLEDPNGFTWVMGCMLAAVIVAFVLIYWRRML